MSMLDCLSKEIDSVPGVVGTFDSVNSLFEAATTQTVDVNRKQGGQQGLDRGDVYALQKVRKYLQRNTMIVWEVDAQWQ